MTRSDKWVGIPLLGACALLCLLAVLLQVDLWLATETQVPATVSSHVLVFSAPDVANTRGRILTGFTQTLTGLWCEEVGGDRQFLVTASLEQVAWPKGTKVTVVVRRGNLFGWSNSDVRLLGKSEP